jgi:hypothetical protein
MVVNALLRHHIPGVHCAIVGDTHFQADTEKETVSKGKTLLAKRLNRLTDAPVIWRPPNAFDMAHIPRKLQAYVGIRTPFKKLILCEACADLVELMESQCVIYHQSRSTCNRQHMRTVGVLGAAQEV